MTIIELVIIGTLVGIYSCSTEETDMPLFISHTSRLVIVFSLYVLFEQHYIAVSLITIGLVLLNLNSVAVTFKKLRKLPKNVLWLYREIKSTM
jgi:hypothetical protein